MPLFVVDVGGGCVISLLVARFSSSPPLGFPSSYLLCRKPFCTRRPFTVILCATPRLELTPLQSFLKGPRSCRAKASAPPGALDGLQALRTVFSMLELACAYLWGTGRLYSPSCRED